MAMGGRTYRCVGGPCDGMLHTLGEGRWIRLAPQDDEALIEAADYDVRRLLAPDSQWHEFLMLSAWTSMQATVWLNRRPRQ